MGEGAAGWATRTPEGVVEFTVNLGAMIGEAAICVGWGTTCAGQAITCAAMETICVDRGIFAAQGKACAGRAKTCVALEITCGGGRTTCVDRETICGGRGITCVDRVRIFAGPVITCAPVVLREFPLRRVAVTTCTGTIDMTVAVTVAVVVADPLRVALATFPRGCGVVNDQSTRTLHKEATISIMVARVVAVEICEAVESRPLDPLGSEEMSALAVVGSVGTAMLARPG